MTRLLLLLPVILLFVHSCNKEPSSSLQVIEADLRITEDNLEEMIRLLDQTVQINGDVTISNTSLQDLSLLKKVRRIEGTLNLRYNDQLTSLHGLETVESLGGLVLNYNAQLSSITHISTISIKGSLMIYQGEIQSIETLDQITELEDLTLSGIRELSNLDFLPKLQAINGDLLLIDNQDLQRLAFPALERIEGRCDIQLNPELVQLTLPEFSSLSGALVITGNNKLPNLNGFAGLRQLAGNLQLQMNNALRHLNGLSEVRATDDLSLFIMENSLLADFCGIKNLIGDTGTYQVNCTIRDNNTNPTASEILSDCP